MKKSWIIVAVLALLAVALWRLSVDRAVSPVAAGREVATVSAQQPTPAAPQGVEPSTAVADSEVAAQALAPPTAAEAEVLVMYDEMTQAFEQNPKSCRDAAIRLEELTKAHEPALTQLRDERAKLNAEQWTAAQARLERGQGERMARMRHAVEQMMARCTSDGRLRAAMRKLAATGSPANSNAE